MKKIIITINNNDYLASLDGTDKTGIGSSIAEAIGTLVLAHRDEFGLELTSPKRTEVKKN